MTVIKMTAIKMTDSSLNVESNKFIPSKPIENGGRRLLASKANQRALSGATGGPRSSLDSLSLSYSLAGRRDGQVAFVQG